jgi:hypothetical protein
VIARLGRARDRELSFRVVGAVRSSWRQHDRAAVGLAEQLEPGVERTDIDQAARSQVEFTEALAVGPQGRVVVDAARHVAEMRRRHVLVRDRLEVEHVERLARTTDQFVEAALAPHHRIGQALYFLREGFRAAQQRAGGKEPQQPAAAG